MIASHNYSHHDCLIQTMQQATHVDSGLLASFTNANLKVQTYYQPDFGNRRRSLWFYPLSTVPSWDSAVRRHTALQSGSRSSWNSLLRKCAETNLYSAHNGARVFVGVGACIPALGKIRTVFQFNFYQVFRPVKKSSERLQGFVQRLHFLDRQTRETVTMTCAVVHLNDFASVI